ncbi:Aste57867_19741 [Aphanomyces stellatus]|uniref:Aste57867_19741 protein n=1 Tax=Aphanomyces stellatus TaxID=120398 RepID=A0A485LDE1_9STRA|nr:hypothetical protein As57867_019676 [Aphanomyces stellatus]VFT96439.1 Aste57867_19741 [Aphanomyces stellatus]
MCHHELDGLPCESFRCLPPLLVLLASLLASKKWSFFSRFRLWPKAAAPQTPPLVSGGVVFTPQNAPTTPFSFAQQQDMRMSLMTPPSSTHQLTLFEPATTQPTFSEHLQTIGDYTLLKAIAEGGNGAIWRAQFKQTSHVDVVKILIDPSEENLAAMKYEGKMLAMLEHCDSVVPCLATFDFTYDDGRPGLALAMPEIESDLWTYLENHVSTISCNFLNFFQGRADDPT